MKMKKLLGAIAALAMATSMTMTTFIVNAKEIANAPDPSKPTEYHVDIGPMLPEGCTLMDVGKIGFTFTGYEQAKGWMNGALVINNASHGWSSMKWGNAGDSEAILNFPDDATGSITIIRDLNGEITPEDTWAQIAIQLFWNDDSVMTVEEVFVLDADGNRLQPKAPAQTDPPVTDPPATDATTPAPSETQATTAATTKAAAAATTKSNPSTGEGSTGMALAVTAAMAAAGIAVASSKRKK